MKIIDGKSLARSTREALAVKIADAAATYGRKPHLAVILVGENPASLTYVNSKAKASIELGMENTTLRLPQSTSEAELLEVIASLNADDAVDAILVQLPLPAHISEPKVIDAIDPSKDVDGFSSQNVAALWQGRPCIVPCTPKGIMKMLASAGIDPKGKRAVVVGRSHIVGLPVAKLLTDANATVTIAHSRTANLGEVTRSAEILVVATGRPALITADMVSPGVVIIDVGINRNSETGRLCGDVDFEGCAPIAGAISPVPGGVGPMTIACLMENTLESFLSRMK